MPPHHPRLGVDRVRRPSLLSAQLAPLTYCHTLAEMFHNGMINYAVDNLLLQEYGYQFVPPTLTELDTISCLSNH